MIKIPAYIKSIFTEKIWLKRLIFALAGAILGYSYYYFVGCYSGTCPISSNPYISILYGAGVGLLISAKKKV